MCVVAACVQFTCFENTHAMPSRDMDLPARYALAHATQRPKLTFSAPVDRGRTATGTGCANDAR